jgi:A/G-specific adenine glycosylase
LATAETATVVRNWQGLGYNRRALFLQALAQEVRATWCGTLPRDPDILRTLPGIGAYTSRSIPVFAHNEPHVFLETNVRSMCIYFFTRMRQPVADSQLEPLVEAILDKSNPRRWYEAMMDVGGVLKREVPLINQKAKTYTKQTKFEGSARQRRGAVLRELSEAPSGRLSQAVLARRLEYPSVDLQNAIESLRKEGFIVVRGETVSLCR